jgi:hypothetical protein
VTFLDTPPRQTERAFMNQVIKAAEVLGWRWYHTHRSDKSPAGFPDLVLVRARHSQPRLLFVELKAERTKVTPDQRVWIDELRACGQEAYIWRPQHWPNIEKLLR